MLDLLEQTHDVIDYAVKAQQSKWRTVWKRKCLSTARGTILAVDKQIVAVKGQIIETRESACIDWRGSQRYAGDQTGGILRKSRPAFRRHSSYELLARRPDLQAMRWYVQASLDQGGFRGRCSIRTLISKRFSVWTPSICIPYSKNQSLVQLHPGSEIAAA